MQEVSSLVGLLEGIHRMYSSYEWWCSGAWCCCLRGVYTCTTYQRRTHSGRPRATM